ncbi:hypothetical protein ACIO7M_31690 [Streptomyces toxytricini]|uniref:Uncharacterized protein n=1 Tax=Streptomyces toxytricini TaxID=67369 RepID=A0ABW8ESR1_STRT5
MASTFNNLGMFHLDAFSDIIRIQFVLEVEAEEMLGPGLAGAGA